MGELSDVGMTPLKALEYPQNRSVASDPSSARKDLGWAPSTGVKPPPPYT